MPDISTALAFIALVNLGVLMHAIKKWALREIRGGVIDWFIVHPRATVAVLMAANGAALASLFSGELNDLRNGHQIVLAFLAGFAIDGFNSQGGTRK